MELTNAMEQSVRVYVNGLRDQSNGGDETCWCPLCHADVIALTLSSLAPHYAIRHPVIDDVDPAVTTAVGEVATLARSQVSRFPKHLHSGAIAAGEPAWVVNFTLEEGFRAIDEVLRHDDRVCGCRYCRCDIAAIVLNRYPARYGVEHGGETHLFEEDRVLIRYELSKFLDLAVRTVRSAPRHRVQPATG